MSRHSPLRLADITAERLVMVTHREPFRLVSREGQLAVERTTGGLIAALEPAMREVNGLWISAGPRKKDGLSSIEEVVEQLPYSWVSVPYSDELYAGFYLGFSNRALWPLYHNLLGMTAYERADWTAYREVNQLFADTIAREIQDDDLVWIHDYQLSLVPKLVRDRGMPTGARIGFFLHIPFPGYDLFRTLPWAREVLEGMLGSSLIGFHVPEYCYNFFECVEQLLGLHCDRLRGRVLVGDRFVHVRAIPIGIDAEAMYEAVATAEVQARAEKLREELGGTCVVIGVDRLDYTKGILERLYALEAFFERYKHRRGVVSMVQVAVPSRAGIDRYQRLRENIERQVGHINGLYARPDWTPLTFMCRSVPFEELAALYHAADIGFVTPLRDGMNLVAKEYVAAHKDKGGVLLLSELAGAAQQLTEAEMLNPYHVDAMAEALERAIDIPLEVQKRRMRTMNAKVRRYDVRHWIESFLNEGIYVE